MILSCPSCPKTYNVPSAALPPGGREVECSACGTVWFERGAMAQAVAAGAAGADVTSGYDPYWNAEPGDIIDVAAQPVDPEQLKRRPAPEPVGPQSEPSESPARAQQTALTVAYAPPTERSADHVDPEAAAAAARLLAKAAIASIKRSLDRALVAAGIVLGTVLHAAARVGKRSVQPLNHSPGDTAARATRARMRAEAVNALTPKRVLGWLFFTAVLGLAVFFATAKADTLQAYFPPAQKLYARFSAPIVTPGLRVEGEVRTYARSSQGPAVVLAGTVVNDGVAEEVPVVTLTAITATGPKTQTLPLPAVALPPGGERPFAVRALIPGGATAITLSVEAGALEPSEGFALQTRGGAWTAPSNGYAGPPGGASAPAPR